METINFDGDDDDDDDGIGPSVDELWEMMGEGEGEGEEDEEGEEDGGFRLPVDVEEFNREMAAAGGYYA